MIKVMVFSEGNLSAIPERMKWLSSFTANVVDGQVVVDGNRFGDTGPIDSLALINAIVEMSKDEPVLA